MVIREGIGNGGFIAVSTTGEIMAAERWSWKSFSKTIKYHCEIEKCAARIYTLGGEYIQTLGEKYKDNLFYDWYKDYEDFENKADRQAKNISSRY